MVKSGLEFTLKFAKPLQIPANLKKFLNPFCFAYTLGLLPCLYKAKWQNIAGSKKFFMLTCQANSALMIRFLALDSSNICC